MLGLSILALVSAAQSAGPIEVPLHVADDALIVQAKVNGVPAALMFDTGFGGSVLMSDSVDIGPATGTSRLKDFVGEFDAKTVPVKSLQLGALNIDSTGMKAIQEETDGLSNDYNAHTDGLLGLEAITNYVTEFNIEHQKLIFYPKSVDITKRVPDNKRTFLAKLLPIGNESLEMLVKTPSGRTMVMALDTGNSFYATTHKDVLERVGLWSPGEPPRFTRMTGIASGPVDSWDIQMPALSVFGVPVPSSVWSVIDLPSVTAESDGTMGFEFLKNFNFTIDFDRRRVWLEDFTGKTGNEPVAEVGIFGGYRARSGHVEVWRVTPGSPADAAGIQKGDEILSVGDQSVVSASFRKLDSLLRGPVDTTVEIAVSHNGELKRYELKRAYLVNQATTQPPK